MGREEVLSAVRDALQKRGRAGGGDGPGVGLARPERLGPDDDLLARFREELQEVSGFVVEAEADWVQAVRGFMRREGLEKVFPSRSLRAEVSGLDVVDEERARQDPESVVGLSRASCGIASTGSVVLEGEGFLPAVLTQTSLVLLATDDVVATLADLPPAAGRRMVVTGPARTADIEKKVVLGAHGPKRAGVVLVRPDRRRGHASGSTLASSRAPSQ